MKKSDRVYFTANILAATDRLELLCHQSNIDYNMCSMSHGMTQLE